jgi:hypothetical protein
MCAYFYILMHIYISTRIHIYSYTCHPHARTLTGVFRRRHGFPVQVRDPPGPGDGHSLHLLRGAAGLHGLHYYTGLETGYVRVYVCVCVCLRNYSLLFATHYTQSWKRFTNAILAIESTRTALYRTQLCIHTHTHTLSLSLPYTHFLMYTLSL